MGKLTYAALRHEFLAIDDRTLTHLQLVITAKLRRGEGFFLTWVEPLELGSGRAGLWIHPGIPLRFEFASPAVVPVNRLWLEQLSLSANSLAGLQVMPEPVETE